MPPFARCELFSRRPSWELVVSFFPSRVTQATQEGPTLALRGTEEPGNASFHAVSHTRSVHLLPSPALLPCRGLSDGQRQGDRGANGARVARGRAGRSRRGRLGPLRNQCLSRSGLPVFHRGTRRIWEARGDFLKYRSELVQWLALAGETVKSY